MSNVETEVIPRRTRIVYTTYAAFPTSGLMAGDLAYATDRLTLYRWSGAVWQAITVYSASGLEASIPAAANLPNGSIYYCTDTTILKQVQAGAWATITQDWYYWQKRRILLNWNSLDGWTVAGTAGGAATINVVAVTLTSAGTGIDDLYTIRGPNDDNIILAGKVLKANFSIGNLNSIADVKRWAVVSTGTGAPVATDKLVGFVIDNATISAVSADGVAAESTDTGVAIATGVQRTRLRFEYTVGTNAKFYVNDVLKATHSARLPGVTPCYIVLGTRNNVAASKTTTFLEGMLEYAF